MMNTKLSLLVIVLLISMSCSRNVGQVDFDQAKVSSEVKERFDAYVNQVNSRGIEGIDSYFSDEEGFHWVEDGVMQYPNKQALVTGISEFLPMVATIDLKVFKYETTVINEQLVSLYIEYKEDVALNSGYAFVLDGAMTILTRKENGTWKFWVGHSSIKKPRGDS